MTVQLEIPFVLSDLDQEYNKKILDLLMIFFQNNLVKVMAWLTTENFNFGGTKPIRLIESGRSKKVLRFIESSKDENEWS